MEFNCKRVVIEGCTSFGIQGQNLRETIEEFVKNPKEDGKPLETWKIRGSVENLKDGRVELIYTGEDTESFHTRLEEDLKMKGYKFKKEFQPAPHYLPEIERLSDFTIKRADDLSEMVLALRGAGYRFVESTKTLQKIYKSDIERDNKIMAGKLHALSYELTYIETQIDESNKNIIPLGAIDANISSPAIAEIEFVHKLMSVSIDLREFRMGNKDPAHLKRSLSALRNIIEKRLQDESVTSK
jgi:acylphosphatase